VILAEVDVAHDHPTRISISATEIPSRMETKLATSASPIQNAAMKPDILNHIGYWLPAICYQH